MKARKPGKRPAAKSMNKRKDDDNKILVDAEMQTMQTDSSRSLSWTRPGCMCYMSMPMGTVEQQLVYRVAACVRGCESKALSAIP